MKTAALIAALITAATVTLAAVPPIKYVVESIYQQEQELDDQKFVQGAGVVLQYRIRTDGTYWDLSGLGARWEARESSTSTNALQSTGAIVTSTTPHYIEFQLDSTQTGSAVTSWYYRVFITDGGSDYPLGIGALDIAASTWTGAAAVLSNVTAAAYTDAAVATHAAVKATTNGLGHVIIGSGLSVDGDGVLSNPQTFPAWGDVTDKPFTNISDIVHSDLSGLGWTESGHTGTAARVAIFSEGGIAGEGTLGTGLTWDGDTINATPTDLSGYVQTNGFAENMDQGVSTTDSPTFVKPTVDGIQLDTTNTDLPTEGGIAFVDDQGGVILGVPGGGYITLGSEMQARAYNDTGGTLTNGTLVTFDGRQGAFPKIVKVSATNVSEKLVVGMVTTSGGIDDKAFGQVTISGLVRGVPNPQSYTDGETLYMADIDGAFTNTPAVYPSEPYVIGKVAVALGGTMSIELSLDGWKTWDVLDGRYLPETDFNSFTGTLGTAAFTDSTNYPTLAGNNTFTGGTNAFRNLTAQSSDGSKLAALGSDSYAASFIDGAGDALVDICNGSYAISVTLGATLLKDTTVDGVFTAATASVTGALDAETVEADSYALTDNRRAISAAVTIPTNATYTVSYADGPQVAYSFGSATNDLTIDFTGPGTNYFADVSIYWAAGYTNRAVTYTNSSGSLTWIGDEPTTGQARILADWIGTNVNLISTWSE